MKLGVPCSCHAPKALMSLLLLGMLPNPIVGQASSSLAPPLYELSFLPDCRSLILDSGGTVVAQSTDGLGSSCLRFASTSSSKLLPGRLASGCDRNSSD